MKREERKREKERLFDFQLPTGPCSVGAIRRLFFALGAESSSLGRAPGGLSSVEDVASPSCSFGSVEVAESVESEMPKPRALTLEEGATVAEAPGADAEETIATAALLANLGEETATLDDTLADTGG